MAKLCDPEAVHKTELGYVLTNLADSVDVEAAAQRLQRHDANHPVLIQAQVPRGIELAVGVVRDEQMGPLVMLATGGVDLDVWADPVFLMPPLTSDRVQSRSSPTAQLATAGGPPGRPPGRPRRPGRAGVRGRPAGDGAA